MPDGLRLPELAGSDMAAVVPLRIELPEDEARTMALWAKRQEYIERISYTAPDTAGFDNVSYKIRVLDGLFEDGEVSAKDILENLRDPNDPNEVFAAEEALRIASDYCLTGGANLIGGSLPGIEADTPPKRSLVPGFLRKIFPIKH